MLLQRRHAAWRPEVATSLHAALPDETQMNGAKKAEVEFISAEKCFPRLVSLDKLSHINSTGVPSFLLSLAG